MLVKTVFMLKPLEAMKPQPKKFSNPKLKNYKTHKNCPHLIQKRFLVLLFDQKSTVHMVLGPGPWQRQTTDRQTIQPNKIRSYGYMLIAKTSH